MHFQLVTGSTVQNIYFSTFLKIWITFPFDVLQCRDSFIHHTLGAKCDCSSFSNGNAYYISAAENATIPREVMELRGAWIRQAKFGKNEMFPLLVILKEGEYINGLVQERRNTCASAMELRLSCTNPSIYWLANSISSLLPNYKIIEQIYVN